jgi:hypothetical protein
MGGITVRPKRTVDALDDLRSDQIDQDLQWIPSPNLKTLNDYLVSPSTPPAAANSDLRTNQEVV